MKFQFDQLRGTSLMGVVNVTPNSFSDGNEFLEPAAAINHGLKLVKDGAAILDLGAEASSFFRPGVQPVAAEAQWERLKGVVEGMKGPQMFGGHRFWMSVDTRSAEVAQRAVLAGAHIVNDISAGTFDPAMLSTVAELQCGMVLMHIADCYPHNASEDDPDIVRTVGNYLSARVEAAIAAGISKTRLAIDPGVGFGKTPADNWRLVMECGSFAQQLGIPVVLGASRKRFLEQNVPTEVSRIAEKLEENPNHPRDPLSAAIVKATASRGVTIHRVHNVGLAAQALKM